MKKYFLTGLATLLPIVLSLFIFIWLIDLLTAPFVDIAEYLLLQFDRHYHLSLNQHLTLTLWLSRILVICSLLLLTLFLGVLAQKYLFSWTLRWMQKILAHIPFIRGLYKMLQEMTQALFDSKQKPLKETVLAPFPHGKARAIGFITGSTPEILQKKAINNDTVVFIPTSPHPISGFLLLYSSQDLQKIETPPEQALKWIISCGVLPLDKEGT